MSDLFTSYDKSYLFNLKEKIINSCENCGGTRIDTNDENGYCKCAVRLKWLVRLYYSHIPKQYWNLELPKSIFKQDIINFYLGNLDSAIKKNLGLYVFGGSGVGKTTLLIFLAKMFLLKGKSVFYMLMDDYIEKLFESDSAEKQIWFEKLKESNILIIDEIEKISGLKNNNHFHKTITENLIRDKMTKDNVLLVGSNIDYDSLSKLFSSSLVSLLRRQLKETYLVGKDYSVKLQDDWEKILKDENEFSVHFDLFAYKFNRFDLNGRV